MTWISTTTNPELASNLEAELKRELAPGHRLYGKVLKAILVKRGSDDVIFENENAFVLVHLTWSGQQETAPEWPAFSEEATLERAKRLGDE